MHRSSYASRGRGKQMLALLLSFLSVSVMFIAACGSSSTSNSNSPITVWIDSDRQKAVDLFKAAHPSEANLINAVVVDRNQFPAKVLLENNINSGWPDVVFAEPDLVAQVSDAAHHFPLDLSSSVSSTIQGNFAGLDSCKINGKLVCLRNDLAQYVMYYNKPLMDQFGYTVPTTWEDYQALGLKVAKEHPGYIIGEFADAFALDTYFWGSQCPFHTVQGNTVYSNLSDPNCTRVAKMLDTLIPSGALSTSAGYFDAGMTKLGNDNKILMMPGPSWLGAALFEGTWYTSGSKQLGVAAPLKWAADSQAYTGALGGAAWTVSNHTKNTALATEFVTWVTTDPSYLGASANYPAYIPTAKIWAASMDSDKYYTTNPFTVMQTSASEFDPKYQYVRFDDRTIFGTSVVTPVLTNHKTVAGTLKDYQDQLTALASSVGYDVKNSSPPAP
jgi:ABC-type glycerol-3-phosphate transport system substrate-binding protein